jgi:hypothetical protein
VAKTGLELVILLPQPPECWDYRCVPPHQAGKYSGFLEILVNVLILAEIPHHGADYVGLPGLTYKALIEYQVLCQGILFLIYIFPKNLDHRFYKMFFFLRDSGSLQG